MLVPLKVVGGRPGKLKLASSAGWATWIARAVDTLGALALLPSNRAVMAWVPAARLLVVRLACCAPFKATPVASGVAPS